MNIQPYVSASRLRHLFWLLPVLSVAMHWRIFSTDLIGVHLWRQSQTQLNIQNFYRHDFNILNPRVNVTNLGESTVYRYEFPLMQWSIAAVHKMLGESIVITRVCLFLLGLGTLYGVFFLMREVFKDISIALLSTWAFNFSPVFYYYTMNPIPDNLALFGGVWGLGWFFRYRNHGALSAAIFSAIGLSVGVAAKLPFILFYAIPGWFLLERLRQTGWRGSAKWLKSGILYGIFLLPTLAWYAWVIPGWHGNGVITGIFENKITWEHAFNILEYHARIMFPKLLLNFGSVWFFIAGIGYIYKHGWYKKETFRLWAACGGLLLAYLLFELNMISTVHDYYMMPFLPPLFVLVGIGIRSMWYGNPRNRNIAVVMLLLLPIIAFISVDNFWSVRKSYINHDLLLHKEALRKAVPDDERCIIINDVSMHIFPYLIDKQGHVFNNDDLPAPWVEDMIRRQHMHYMYSDSRKVDENPAIVPFLDTLLLEKGSVRVYRLKTEAQLPPAGN